ncbi:hypothetical protein K469DRAFT_684144 [Zopfia rhizophila CBS 207.26]|uniref:Uncharacterized protein n=1 Tax=Zopfia rhizophila CBS 207.26 TaxID=1314779 RepID=A0A6A6ECC9_9PEZI|nr:hypothetical protein K469DRAFT_684144 [Zopfia rhizophila CBS 207.26]
MDPDDARGAISNNISASNVSHEDDKPALLPESITENSVRHSKAAFFEPFCQILACFGCPVPVNLFIRAVRPKTIWRSNGRFDTATPFEHILVPSWLEKVPGFQNSHANDDKEWLQSARTDGVEIIMQSGIQCLKLSTDACEHVSQLMSVEERRKQLSTCIAITIHAFPSRFAEIAEEEVAFQFLPLLQTSVLPLLAVSTDDDIWEWLIPCWCDSRESRQANRGLYRANFLVSLLELLYMTTLALGLDSHSLPKSLPRRLHSLVRQKFSLLDVLDYYCSVLVDFLEAITGLAPQGKSPVRRFGHKSSHARSSRDKSDVLPFFPFQNKRPVDEKTNATVGIILASLSFSRGGSEELIEARKLALNLQRQWSPLWPSDPSPMETVAASFIAGPALCPKQLLNTYLKPQSQYQLDIEVIRALVGFNFVRHGALKEASQLLHVCVGRIPDSFDQGLVTAELARCYNLLRKERTAKTLTEKAIIDRYKTNSTLRPDWNYIRMAHADSLIGLAEYNQAADVLREVLGSRSASETVRMSALLRYSKVQRRLRKGGKGLLRYDGSLRQGANLLHIVPTAQKADYIRRSWIHYFSKYKTSFGIRIQYCNNTRQWSGTCKRSRGTERWFSKFILTERFRFH